MKQDAYFRSVVGCFGCYPKTIIEPDKRVRTDMKLEVGNQLNFILCTLGYDSKPKRFGNVFQVFNCYFANI